jgi:hypothetical protein
VSVALKPVVAEPVVVSSAVDGSSLERLRDELQKFPDEAT